METKSPIVPIRNIFILYPLLRERLQKKIFDQHEREILFFYFTQCVFQYLDKESQTLEGIAQCIKRIQATNQWPRFRNKIENIFDCFESIKDGDDISQFE